MSLTELPFADRRKKTPGIAVPAEAVADPAIPVGFAGWGPSGEFNDNADVGVLPLDGVRLSSAPALRAPQFEALLTAVVALGDVALITGIAIAAARFGGEAGLLLTSDGMWDVVSPILTCLAVLVVGDGYAPGRRFRPSVKTLLATAAALFGLRAGMSHSLAHAGIGAFAFTAGLWAWRHAAGVVKARFVPAELGRRTAFLIGDASPSGPLISQRYAVVGGVALSQCMSSEERLNETIARIRRADPEEIIVVAAPARMAALQPLLGELRKLPAVVRLAGDILPVPVGADAVEVVGRTAVIRVQSSPLTYAGAVAKRALDVVVSTAALVALWPLLVVVSALIKLDSPGRLIFRQSRTGYNGHIFDCLKFRSMTVEENGAKVSQAKKNDSRITRVGRLCRRWSLDELPQLVNVLRGDMTLVGPRPHAVAHDQEFRSVVGNYDERFKVKPGITGLSQISGYRGETPTPDLVVNRVELDRWYVDNWSLWLDIKILLRTAIAIFHSRGAH